MKTRDRKTTAQRAERPSRTGYGNKTRNRKTTSVGAARQLPAIARVLFSRAGPRPQYIGPSLLFCVARPRAPACPENCGDRRSHDKLGRAPITDHGSRNAPAGTSRCADDRAFTLKAVLVRIVGRSRHRHTLRHADRPGWSRVNVSHLGRAPRLHHGTRSSSRTRGAVSAGQQSGNGTSCCIRVAQYSGGFHARRLPGRISARHHARAFSQYLPATAEYAEPDTERGRHGGAPGSIDFANRYHHDTNAAWETAAINDQALTHYASRALRFAQRN
jgi:hypothetical protein